MGTPEPAAAKAQPAAVMDRLALREAIALRRGYSWYYSPTRDWYYLLSDQRVAAGRRSSRYHVYPACPYSELVKVEQPDRYRYNLDLPSVEPWDIYIAAAWVLLEEMRQDGREVSVTFVSNSYNQFTGWMVDVGPKNGLQTFFTTRGETPMLAICLAWQEWDGGKHGITG